MPTAGLARAAALQIFKRQQNSQGGKLSPEQTALYHELHITTSKEQWHHSKGH